MAALGSSTINRAVTGGWWMGGGLVFARSSTATITTNSLRCALAIREARPGSVPQKSFDGGRSWIVSASSSKHRRIDRVPIDEPVFRRRRGRLQRNARCRAAVAGHLLQRLPSRRRETGGRRGRYAVGDRDAPARRVSVWNDGIWRYPPPTEEGALDYEPANPSSEPTGPAIRGASRWVLGSLPALEHVPEAVRDAAQSRARSRIRAGRDLHLLLDLADDPTKWSAPQRTLAGGKWYPQGRDGIGHRQLPGERARHLFVRRIEAGNRVPAARTPWLDGSHVLVRGYRRAQGRGRSQEWVHGVGHVSVWTCVEPERLDGQRTPDPPAPVSLTTTVETLMRKASRASTACSRHSGGTLFPRSARTAREASGVVVTGAVHSDTRDR